MSIGWLEALRSQLQLSLPTAHVEWGSLCHEAKPVLFASLLQDRTDPVLIVTHSLERAEAWMAILLRLGFPEGSVLRLPSGLTPLIEPTGIELEVRHERIGVLHRLLEGSSSLDSPLCVIAPVSAALQRTLPPDPFRLSTLQIEQGQQRGLEELLHALLRLGYEYQEPVRLPGQFARRGGIVDLFPLGAEWPVRVEFFGDEVESLRRFEPATQCSIQELEQVVVPPAREVPMGDEQTAEHVRQAWTERAQGMPQEAGKVALENLEADLKPLLQGEPFDRLELYLPWLLKERACALDYLPPSGYLILDEPSLITAGYEKAFGELRAAFQSRLERGDLVPLAPTDYLEPIERLSQPCKVLALAMLETASPAAGIEPRPSEWWQPRQRREIGARTLETYRGQLPALRSALADWVQQGFQIVIASDQPTRVGYLLREQGLRLPLDEPAAESVSAVALFKGNLGGGFVIETGRFALLTDAELFNLQRLRLPARKFNEGVPITSIMDLKPGDYVVHIHYGIGIFRGLVTLEREGVVKEYLQIEYAPPDRLYVPVDQLDRVQKYLAPDDRPPEIKRLNSLTWAKAVATARKQAQQVARELVQLHALREKVQRTPCGADTPWQEEMESGFPYTETPTQLQAILEVKNDLMAPHPMDRLICGDVGFGKTEVAIRAAFKVILEGRQVAVLCPTTVLAFQHWQTFSERFAPYPIKVELLSRLLRPKEQRAVLQGLKTGGVDLVIGTHRLLSQDVKFHRLGLVIIDEEQRFGVMQKERFKQLRATVDVLSLSATPIPRTLYMALANIRDMSLITDPPPGRLPIRTYVQPYSDWLVQEAILRELQRSGQLFYVHNRVQALNSVACKLHQLVPQARIAVAHGQMPPAELEEIMLAFYRHEYDILVCTTIIENGLDLPNVNTLIVDHAEQFGLAQLYQLRGRVGRSDRQAYAYLLYRAGHKLSEATWNRLQALKEFSHLGSGFALALRDLEIRGAGNLLGTEQHGAMQLVGYELYQMILQEAIRQLRHGERELQLQTPLQPELPPLELPLKAYLPQDYIPNDAQRLWYYKRLAGAREAKELDELRRELRDRYGALPAPALEALRVMQIRLQAAALGVEKITGDRYRVRILFRADHRLNASLQLALQRQFRGLKTRPDYLLILRPADPLEAIRSVLEAMRRCSSTV